MSPWIASIVAVALQSPLAQEPAERHPPPLVLRIGQCAPPLDECEWLQGTDGSGAGSVVKRVGGGGELPFDPGDIEKAIHAVGAPDLAKLHGSVVVVHAFDSRDGAMISEGLSLLRDLANANDDRKLALVSLVEKSDAEGAKHAFEYAQLTNPLGAVERDGTYFDRIEHGARAAFVIGRSGELVWTGDLVAQPKPFCEALKVALARRAAPRVERTLHEALEPALSEYWGGRFESVRGTLKKLAGKPAPGADGARLAADAGYLAELVDLQQRDLVTRARQAGAAGNVDALVELEAALRAGFSKPASEAATEELKRLDDDLLGAGRMQDARKWLELERERPLFFPARSDADNKKFAKKLEAFVRSTPNATPPIARARRLLEKYARL